MWLAGIISTLLQSYVLKKSTDTKRGFVGAKVSYREHALAYPNHSFMTCGSPLALTSKFFFEKCGVKSISGEHEYYIRRSHLELPYHNPHHYYYYYHYYYLSMFRIGCYHFGFAFGRFAIDAILSSDKCKTYSCWKRHILSRVCRFRKSV